MTPITLTSTRRPMSSLSIAFIIVGLLIVLIGYAFIYQALEKRRKQRQRLMAALKYRQRSFKRMLVSFPAGFLPKDLNLVVYQALIEAAEQLRRLEPKSGHIRKRSRCIPENWRISASKTIPRRCAWRPLNRWWICAGSCKT